MTNGPCGCLLRLVFVPLLMKRQEYTGWTGRQRSDVHAGVGVTG